MAKLAVIADAMPGQSFDFEAIWADQSVSPPVEEAGLVIARRVFDLLTDEKRPIVNVTEWAKREACWDWVRAARIALPQGFSTALVSNTRVAERRAAAVALQKIDSGIAAQTRVIEMGVPTWDSVREFVMSRRLVTPTQLGILDVATGRRRGFPSEKQSAVLLAVLKTAEENGFESGQ